MTKIALAIDLLATPLQQPRNAQEEGNKVCLYQFSSTASRSRRKLTEVKNISKNTQTDSLFLKSVKDYE